MRARFVAILYVLTFSAPVMGQSGFRFFDPVVPPRAVQIVARRGMTSLAPENSAPAIRACSIDFIEWALVDVRLTKDGAHVLQGDAMLDRTTNGRGPVAEISRDDFLQLDAGEWFAPRFRKTPPLTLRDGLAMARGKVNLLLECHAVDPGTLVQEIVDARMEQQVAVVADPPLLMKIRETGRDSIATIARFNPATDDFERLLKELDPAGVLLPLSESVPGSDQFRPQASGPKPQAPPPAEWCRRFHERGIKVCAAASAASGDDAATWTRWIEAKVDWIVTDRPAALRFTEVRRRIPQFPVKIAHHRGTSRYAPENTLSAIRTAASLGADYIEIDIRATKDGKFVLLHDGSLDRTTDGQGPVAEKQADEIAHLSAGAWFGKPFAEERVPTLGEGLDALGPTAAGYLDAKSIAPESLVAAIRAHNLLERCVVYQSPEYLEKLRAIEPAVRTQPPLRSADNFEKVAAQKPYCVDARWSALSPELIARCHQAGILVFSDALGFNETIEQYLRAMEWGVDLIQTDHPLRVLRAIELHAMKSP